MRIQEVIETIKKQVPGENKPKSGDTVKAGDVSRQVEGIVATFMATRAVLERAVALGANFIITHEPTFYDGRDETSWLEKDEVYNLKRKLIDDHGLVIWRFHDGIHRMRPDGIELGVAQKLGWESDPARRQVYTLPPQTVRALAESCKERLGIAQVRVAGDLEAVCSSVGLLVGAWGGRIQIEMFRDHSVDVVVCGESPEWETCEYVRDAVAMGRKKALIVLGHANSEEAGMKWFANWLRPQLTADIPLHYVAAGDPFQFV